MAVAKVKPGLMLGAGASGSRPIVSASLMRPGSPTAGRIAADLRMVHLPAGLVAGLLAIHRRRMFAMRSTVSGENTRMLPARASGSHASCFDCVLDAVDRFAKLAGYGSDRQCGLWIHSVSSQHRRPLCGATHVALANGLTYAGRSTPRS